MAAEKFEKLEARLIAPVQVLDDGELRLPRCKPVEILEKRKEQAVLFFFGAERRTQWHLQQERGQLRHDLDNLGGGRPKVKWVRELIE